MKRDVLTIEYDNAFDMVACKIVYQDESVLPRDFEDNELGIKSYGCISFDNNILSLRGNTKQSDDRIIILDKSQAEILKDKVNKINEKYGIKIPYKPQDGDYYDYIDFDNLEVAGTSWQDDGFDNHCYEIGNCFEKVEHAEEAIKRIKKTLKDYQEELLKEE